MKAKILNFNDQVEVQLANGKNFRAAEDQDSSNLMDQVEAYITEDLLEEAEFSELTIKQLSAKNTKQLVNSLTKSKGLLTDMIASILEAREVDYELPAVEVEVEAEETETDEAPVVADKPKNKRNPKTDAEAAPAKEKKEQPSFEEAMDLLKEAKKNAGTVIEFKPFSKDGDAIQGIIKTAGIDKRRNRVYFCVEIETETGKKIVHPSIDNDTIVVDMIATEAYTKEKEEAEAEKVRAAEKKKAVDAEKVKEAEENKEAVETKKAEKEAAAIKPAVKVTKTTAKK